MGQLLRNIESVLQNYDEEEETSQATGQAGLGRQVISALDIFGQPTHKQVEEQADLLAQTANAVKIAKLALQQNLQGGQKNNEVQGIAAGYIDQETTKLDDIVGELAKLSTEKEVNGKLSTESKEKVKEITEQIAEEKKAISNKLAVAQVNGQISGNTLDNMKKSEQLLGNIESALQHYDEEEEETSQATGQAALGKQVISALDIFGQPTHKQVGKAKQADLLAQTANAVKNAKLALQENLQGGQKNNEVQGVDAGYIDQETTKLDDIVGELSKLSTEKKVNGELSTESKEKVKELTEQIAEEKKAISSKVAVAQVNGQISGKTLDNMKKSEQLLGNIESVLQNYDEETSQATGQAGLGRQ